MDDVAKRGPYRPEPSFIPRIIIAQPTSFVALATGFRLGPYEIVSPIGVGGMDI
jgi:hypothetical protein